MEKRGSVSTKNLRDLLIRAGELETAIVLNCDTIKRSAVAVFAVGNNAELLKKVLTETDVFEKYSNSKPREINDLIKEAKEHESVVIFDLDGIVPTGVAVAAVGAHAMRIKRALDRADAIARSDDGEG